eukprot:3050264-Amphidinium_carterae.1
MVMVNQLTGEFPEQGMRSMTSLRNFQVQANKLSGTWSLRNVKFTTPTQGPPNLPKNRTQFTQGGHNPKWHC